MLACAACEGRDTVVAGAVLSRLREPAGRLLAVGLLSATVQGWGADAYVAHFPNSWRSTVRWVLLLQPRVVWAAELRAGSFLRRHVRSSGVSSVDAAWLAAVAVDGV
jgi:hypothetical protein